jgi:hypothetical protein
LLAGTSLRPETESSTLIKDGATVFFRPFYGSNISGQSDSEFQSQEYFFMGSPYAGDAVQAKGGSSSDPSDAMYWTLELSETDTDGSSIYLLHNTKFDLYLSPANGSPTMVTKENAGHYKFIAGTNTSMSKGSSGDTYDMTWFVYFYDVNNKSGFDTNASTKVSKTGPFTPGTTTNFADSGGSANGNAYYTVVAAPVDINNAKEIIYAGLNDKLLYLTPNPNQSRFTAASIQYISCASEANIATKNYPYGVTMSNGKRCMWQLIETGTYGVYYIQNVATKYYIGVPTGSQTSEVPMVASQEEAGKYIAHNKTGADSDAAGLTNVVEFQYYGQSWYLNVATSDEFKVGTWSSGGINAYLVFTEVPEETLNGTRHMQNDITEGEEMFLRNAQGKNYLTITNNTNATLTFGMQSDPKGWNSAWLFKSTGAKDEEGRTIYNILNVQRKLYIAPTSKDAAKVAVSYVNEAKEAGRYVILDPYTGDDYCGIYDVDNPAYGYLQISNNVLYNASDFDYAFIPQPANTTAINYVYPGCDVILSPLSLGTEGFTNLYSDFNIIKSENVDATWQGVWQLVAAPGYPRYIDEKNLVHIMKEEQTTTSTDNEGNETTTTTKVDYGSDDYPTMAYTLYNRDEMLYMMIDTNNNNQMTTTTDASEATCFKVEINGDGVEAGSAVGNLAHFAVVTNGGEGIDYEPTGQYLKFNGEALVAIDNGGISYNDDSAFYIRAAINTSFDGCYDGAKIYMYPSALQLWNKRMYAKMDTNPTQIFREAKDDPVNHGALTVWTLIQCKASDTRATSQYNTYTDDQLKDVYYIYNEATKRYMGPLIGLQTSKDHVALVENQEKAGRYKFISCKANMDAIMAYDVDFDSGDDGMVVNTKGKFLNVSALSNDGATYCMVPWGYGGSNSIFFTNNPVSYDVPATSYITDGAYITMIPWDYQGDPNNVKTTTESQKYNEKGGYVYQSTEGNSVECAKTEALEEVDPLYYTWKIVAARDDNGEIIPDVYYLINAKTGAYMPSTTTDGTALSTVSATGSTIPDGAGRFTPVLDTDTGLYVAFRDYDTTLNGSSTYGYLGNDVTATGAASMNTRTLAASTNLSYYKTEERYEPVYNPELGGTQEMTVKYHTYSYTQYWYYINPIDISTSSTLVDEDYLQWAIDNLNTETGRTVGYFDAVELTGVTGPLVELVDGEYKITDFTERELTLAELINLVMYNYKNQDSLEGEAQSAAEDALKKLKECLDSEEYIVHPRIGRFYEITSPYGFYDGLKLRETYTAKYYNELQGQQQVHFLKDKIDTDAVTAFWRFDLVDNDESVTYKDGNRHYFHIRAVNSRDVLRRLNTTIVADSRPDTNMEAGLFALNKDYNLNVYAGSALLRSYINNTDRSYAEQGSFLGIWSPEGTEDPTEAVVRSGSDERVEAEATKQPTGAANNWTITELKQVPVFFWNTIKDTEASDDESNSQGHTYYYNTFCFPFTVEIPKETGLNVFTDVDAVSIDNKVSFKGPEATSNDDDGSLSTIIPAFQPFILETENPNERPMLNIVYGKGEEYGLYDKKDRYRDADWKAICEEYGISTVDRSTYLKEVAEAEENTEWSMTSIVHLAPYTSTEKGKTNTAISRARYNANGDATVVGNICPDPLESEATAYVIHDDCDNVATLVTEGVHSSYTSTDDALYTSTSSYIIPCNSAVLVLPTDTNLKIDEDVVSGTEDIQQDLILIREPERDANGNLIYYDLLGRRTTNPGTGIYILTNGQKVVIRK